MSNDAHNSQPEDAVTDKHMGHNLDGIPNYNTVNDETRAFMDEIIATIVTDDINSVIAFGKEPMEKLGRVAQTVMEKTSGQSGELATFDGLQEQLGGIDIASLSAKAANLGKSGFGWAAKNPGTAITTAGAMMVAGPLALVGVPAAKVMYDKAQAKRTGADIGDDLRKSIAESTNVIDALKRSSEEIPRAIEDLDALGRSRVDAYREVSVYIGAGLEKLRRINEEEMPELEQKANESTDPEATLNYENALMTRDSLDQRITDMFSSKLVSQYAMVTLSRLKSTFALAAGKIQSHLAVSVPQWQAQMAEAGVQMTGFEIAKTIDEADRFGSRVLEQGQKVSQRTTRMIEDSARRGTYDAKKVVAVLENMQRSIADDARLIEDRSQELEKTRRALSDASTKFNSSMAGLSGNAAARIGMSGAPKAALLEDQSSDSKPAPKNG